MNKVEKQGNGANLLIFLGWLTYMTSYLGKVNYSANITQIIDYYHITKPQAGIVPTFFFFAYGIGQAVNGVLCKKYNMKWIIFASMMVSALINLVIALSTNFAMIKWLWMINGFALSILWPTIVRLLAESLPKKDLGRSSVIMGTTVACGTLIIYGLSSVYAIFDKFKLAFYTAAFSGTAVAIIWILIYNKAVKMAKSQRAEDDFSEEEKENPTAKTEMSKKEKSIFMLTMYVLCFVAIGVNLTKDGLTTWVPSILKEEYSMSDSLSIRLTLLLPIVAVFGNACALSMHKKLPDYITHCAAVFVIMAGFIGLIIKSLIIKQVIFMIAGLIIVNFLASSLNSLITSIFPMFMREHGNPGMYAGVLNGFCYVGSTISSYGLGCIAEHFGWMSVFWFLMGFCVLVCVIWCCYKVLKRGFERR